MVKTVVCIEDEEDIRDGLKALEEKGDTLDWGTFKRKHLGLPG